MNLLELTLRLKGFPIAKAKERLKAIKKVKDEEYSLFIGELKKSVFEYHKENNTSYLSFLEKSNALNAKSWEEIPILTKTDLQQPLSQRFSRGFTSKNSYVNKTSGSSGHPFVFAKDKFSHALTWANIIATYKQHGIDYHSDLQARFYGIPLDKKGYYKERIKDVLSSRYRFPIFDLSDEKMESFLDIFRRKKFSYINGYTSSIVLFAKFLKKKNIVLTSVCPTLKHCLVTSEMLFEDDKKILEMQLGVPVLNEYGASELDLIAFTNTNGDLQLNNETLFVEIVDEKGNNLPYGDKGRIVVTSLYNKALAMIRYDIGDVGIIDPKSTPKTTILKQLIGRTNDITTLPSGKTVPGLTFYYVTKSVIEDDGNVKEFVVQQHALNSFTIIYTSEVPLTQENKGIIKKALDTYLEPGLTLSFKRVDVLDRSARGKLKQFESFVEQ
ncbi:phenylacetate--CoA ligase family protein [Patiriisocius hiemis]|uniref:Phenylacetate--CoA ligase family protein n=1 Tax=Patiriisocius hiemis TaxID=3075604 RepID=A0ABU2YBJ2_9FLAO|nr:phenylacetate--CoA ligase family protein [Constantimarinum sp. W242]MDT0555556.1 phenylacetate--CoA ligase family protein [Constantimarinum sp. W242]